MDSAALRKKLAAMVCAQRRDLPWRRTRDPYAIWISEIMLQQTRVAAAIPYYERFLARFPDAAALAQASEDEVLTHWSGLGLLFAGAQSAQSRAGSLRRQGAIPERLRQRSASFPESAITLPPRSPASRSGFRMRWWTGMCAEWSCVSPTTRARMCNK